MNEIVNMRKKVINLKQKIEKKFVFQQPLTFWNPILVLII